MTTTDASLEAVYKDKAEFELTEAQAKYDSLFRLYLSSKACTEKISNLVLELRKKRDEKLREYNFVIRNPK